MMITNGGGGGYYPSPYGSAPFSNIPYNFNMGPSRISPHYNLAYQQRQQKSPAEQFQTRPNAQPNIAAIPSFKLYDLDSNGSSDIIRLIFAYAGVFHRDKRFKAEEWEKIKGQLPIEQLPILRVNKQLKIFHLHAIIHYLAREFRLYGVGQHDHAIVDIILETIRPFQEQIYERLNPSTDQEQSFKQFITDHCTNYLNQLEKFYDIFNRPGPFYLGTQISLADLIVYDTINYLLKFDAKLLDNYSHLKEARRRLAKHPKIARYHDGKTAKQNKTSPESPTTNVTSHHHHRHQSHDDHHHHHHHHRHHHHRHHSKEPTPLTKRSTRSSKSSSLSRKFKNPSDINPSPPISTSKQTSEPIVN